MTDQSAAIVPPRPPRPQPPRIDLIPVELKDRSQWVVWKYGLREGKWTKIPYQPRKPRRKAKADVASTWAMFAEAWAAYERGGFDGIGYEFDVNDPYFGGDVDNCLRGGLVLDWAESIVERLKTYGEISPSGNGIKFIGKGALPETKGTRRSGMGPDGTGALELYDHGRFFTITGEAFGELMPIVELQGVAESLYAIAKERPAKQSPEPSPFNKQVPSDPADDTDEERIEKARHSKQGPKFTALFDSGDVSAYAGDESSADLALANMLAFWLDRDFARIESAFSQSALGHRDKWKARAEYRKWTIDKAIASCQETFGAKFSSNGKSHSSDVQHDDKRPEIFVTTEEHHVNDQAIAALCGDPSLDLYQRNLKLVTIGWDTRSKDGDASGIARAEGTPLIRPIQSARLREDLTRVAAWKAWSKPDRAGKSKVIKAHPPTWSINAILAREKWSGVRHLVGIVESPTLRADGSVIETRGFDQRTGLLYVPNDVFPAIPQSPTLLDARKAAELLFSVVKDFPFKSGHKAAWVAALLTPLARFLIDGPCPMFLFEANTSGAGKTLLCDLIAIVNTGRPMTRTGYTHDPVEMDKQITSTALAGDLLVLFDNLDNGGRFGNSALDRASTGRTYRGRVLGKLEMTPDLDLVCVFYVTGNNVQLCGDVVRRIVPCRLESPEERPEERSGFAIPDILGYVAKNRGELAKAALTIIRSYILAGKPDQKLTPMDFPAWSALIRGAVHWATGLDPCVGRKDLAGSNPDREHAAALVEGWHELQQGADVKGMTSADMIKRLKESTDSSYTTLRDALADLWPKTKAGELPTSGSIGNKIQTIRGQVFNGKRFNALSSEKRAKVWSVTMPDTTGESGESNESISNSRRGETTYDMCKTDSSKSVNQNGRSEKQPHQTHQTHQARFQPASVNLEDFHDPERDGG